MATTIDALGLTEDFEKAGFSRDQAFGMARAIRDHSHETLATKADLHELELRLDSRFAQVDTRFAQVDSRFEHLEQQMEARFAQVSECFVWLEQKWDERLEKLKAELEERISQAQIGLIKWFTGIMIAQTAVIIAVIRLMPGAG